MAECPIAHKLRQVPKLLPHRCSTTERKVERTLLNMKGGTIETRHTRSAITFFRVLFLEGEWEVFETINFYFREVAISDFKCKP